MMGIHVLYFSSKHKKDNYYFYLYTFEIIDFTSFTIILDSFIEKEIYIGRWKQMEAALYKGQGTTKITAVRDCKSFSISN